MWYRVYGALKKIYNGLKGWCEKRFCFCLKSVLCFVGVYDVNKSWMMRQIQLGKKTSFK